MTISLILRLLLEVVFSTAAILAALCAVAFALQCVLRTLDEEDKEE